MVAVTLAALATLVYTYAVYPVSIAIGARLKPMRLSADPDYRPTVSAIIPAYNAQDYVDSKIDSLLAQDYPPDRLEILICSDASNDDTDRRLRERADRDARVRVFRSDERRGKPSAINLLKPHARGDVLLMTDIRQPLTPGALPALLAPLADPGVGCVSGNLVLRGEQGAGVYWQYEKLIRHWESRFRGMVGVTGSIYAIRRADLPDLPTDVILDDMWVPLRLRLEGKRIVMAPEAIAYDEAFPDRRELDRKIRTLAGNYQLLALLPRLLLPFVNPSWFELLSHKLLRLLGPWLLIAVFAGSVMSAAAPAETIGPAMSWFMRCLAGAQVALYAAAVLGRRAGRLAGLARTFVVLNYAAAVGLWRALFGHQRVTW